MLQITTRICDPLLLSDPDPVVFLLQKLRFPLSHLDVSVLFNEEPRQLEPVLGIRNRRIRMFLGLPDPDPLVRGTDPDPDLSLFSQMC